MGTWEKYTGKSGAETMVALSTSEKQGLGEMEVRRRLRKFGVNAISGKEVTGFDIGLRQVKSPFIYLLVVAAGISLALGQRIDAGIIMGFVGLNLALGFYQEYHSYRTLKLLQKFVTTKARAIRRGEEVWVESSRLVPGDIVKVVAGDKIQADMRWLSAKGLTVDESVLTGESVPVAKTARRLSEVIRGIYRAANMGFSGTMATAGKGMGVVVATGKQSAIGEIFKLTAKTTSVGSFEKGVGKFSQFILRLILVTLALVFAANWAIKGGGENVFSLAVFTIALAVSVIPEALPVVTTFSLSRGAMKLAQKKVVVKRLAAIEDLGSIQVLCSDKTGTLTENRLRLADFWGKEAVFWGAVAGETAADHQKVNPFDGALREKLTTKERGKLESFVRREEIPFDPGRRRNTVLVTKAAKKEGVLLSRGAPEEIMSLCKGVEKRRRIEAFLGEQGTLGRRVIGVARKMMVGTGGNLSREEKGMEFLGLLAFADPLKPSAAKAIEKAKRLGVRVKILTGDTKEVAGAVAGEIGLIETADEVISGEEFRRLTDKKKLGAVEKYLVFARVTPDLKYEIIELLQRKYEVGYLGEGINDAPALNVANVALVVDGAADIAKDTADIVLLRPSLKVIVDGIEEGRKVFANTVKYIKVTLTSNFGNFFAVASASLLVDFLPMLPLQILLLNLLSDFPMIAIAGDNVDVAEVKIPKLYNVREMALFALILGGVSTVFDFVFFGLFWRISPAVLQTNWFIGSVLTELALIYSLRSRLPFFKAKRPATGLLGLTILAVAAALALPFSGLGQRVFQFSRPSGVFLVVILGVVGVYFVATETVKLLYYRFSNYD